MSTSAKTILKINSSGRQTGSLSRQLVDDLSGKLQQASAGAKVIERDVATGLPVVDEQWIGANFTPAENRADSQKETLALSDTLVDELVEADVLVIGVPMYNFGIPAALKLWVDLVARVGRTFQYTENGPQGLLTGKKAYIVIASGGVPTGSDMDFASPYLKFALAFIGITDVEIISANGSSMDADGTLANGRAEVDALQLVA